ncbi:MAG: hypothetical protein Kow0092_07850 [Deferrisomatales bacterium]
MVRAWIWLRCAAVGDEVRPVQRAPARIGWEGRRRAVALEIERGFRGDELLRRMKGWVTTDPDELLSLVERRGRLRVLDDRDLVVECRSPADYEALERELRERFGDGVRLEPVAAAA